MNVCVCVLRVWAQESEFEKSLINYTLAQRAIMIVNCKILGKRDLHAFNGQAFYNINTFTYNVHKQNAQGIKVKFL